jgi:hypothetical protein
MGETVPHHHTGQGGIDNGARVRWWSNRRKSWRTGTVREYAFDGPRGAWYRIEPDDDRGDRWTSVRIFDVLADDNPPASGSL